VDHEKLSSPTIRTKSGSSTPIRRPACGEGAHGIDSRLSGDQKGDAIGLRRALHAQQHQGGSGDIGPRFDGAPDLEFRAATKALELEKAALSYQRVPPGYRFPYGHKHETQEEVYVVLRGSGRMKVDDEIVELKEWDAVRVPPGTWQGYEAGPDGLEIFVIGAPNLGEDPREDVDGQRDWWAD
jgi:mannose-6-phosphate isomerase-like protein (cupin superfamily)